MREIGSEFWKVETGDHPCSLFPSAAQWYLSGRSALQAIIRELSWAKTVSMPAWFCDSMAKPFIDAGMTVKFYPVYPEHGLRQEIDPDADVLFVMDYFGFTGDHKVDHPCVIRDVTHSLFSGLHRDADYFFGSLRKWCGVWTGGYAWAKDGHMLPSGNSGGTRYLVLRSEAMKRKSCYINGTLDENGRTVADKAYLQLFEEAEKELENVGVVPAAVRDVSLAGMLDAAFVKEKRRNNAAILMKAVPEMLLFPELKEDDCPMFVPILVPDGERDALRRFLIEHQIYCPAHWPLSEYHHVDERSSALYRNELSLVCDQRYSSQDMNRIADTLKQFTEDR